MRVNFSKASFLAHNYHSSLTSYTYKIRYFEYLISVLTRKHADKVGGLRARPLRILEFYNSVYMLIFLFSEVVNRCPQKNIICTCLLVSTVSKDISKVKQFVIYKGYISLRNHVHQLKHVKLYVPFGNIHQVA